MTFKRWSTKQINRLLFKLAVWWDNRIEHRDVGFCTTIDDFYIRCELWK